MHRGEPPLPHLAQLDLVSGRNQVCLQHVEADQSRAPGLYNQSVDKQAGRQYRELTAYPRTEQRSIDTKKQYLKTLINRNKLSKKEFQLKYKNTPLRFYKKKFFLKNFLKNKKVNKIQFKKMPKHALDSKYGYSVIIKLNN